MKSRFKRLLNSLLLLKHLIDKTFQGKTNFTKQTKLIEINIAHNLENITHMRTV